MPQSTRDAFALLVQGEWIDATLADRFKRMVEFRNIAVHDYHSVQLSITLAILKTHLDEFLQYSEALLRRDTSSRYE